MPFLRSKPVLQTPPRQPTFKPAKAEPAAAQPARPVAAPTYADLRWQADTVSGTRKIGFYLILSLVFLRFSFLHEVLAFGFGINMYLIVVFGGMTALALFVSGGIGRALTHRIGWMWVAFAVIMCMSTLFSHWISGSAGVVKTYFKSELPMFFMIAGLVMTVREVMLVMKTIALGLFVNIFIARTFGDIWVDRFALEFGSVANPNDFATHLLLMLPFAAFAIYASTGTAIVSRLAFSAVSVIALYYALSTASRAAVISMAVGLLFILFRMSGRQRLIITAFVVLVFVVASITLPSRIVRRYTTFFDWGTAGQELSEAVGSAEARRELAKSALILTLKNPLLGVGPGEFSDVNGEQRRARGMTGHWQVTHNSFLEVSSENGIPAVILYIAAIIFAYQLASRIYGATSKDRAQRQLAMASFCLMLAIVICSTSLFFCSLGYRHYFPSLTGLSVALWIAVSRERRQVAATVPAVARPVLPATSASRLTRLRPHDSFSR